MAFFEQIGKRITDTGQSVAQQTKNLADVTKLNSVISEKEKEISQLFFSIGQSYYERYKNDNTVEDFDKISEVTVLYDEIMNCREKIKQIKGIVKCKNCGGDVPLNAVFCNVCGTKVNRSEDNKENIENNECKRTCQACQSLIGMDNVFCNFCGAKIEDVNE